jgi:hypothetical protein
MSVDFDFIGSSDKPALLAVSTPEWQDTAKLALGELGYKVHVAGNHEDFLVRFGQVQYKTVIIEELFFSGSIEENQALLALQNMPMPQRRHAAVILLGDSFQTFNALQAFQQSVQAVVNRAEIFLLGQLIEKTFEENEQFNHIFHDIQNRLGKEKAQ